MEKEKTKKKKSNKRIYLMVLLIAILLIIPAIFLVSAALWVNDEAPFVYWKFNESTGTVVGDTTPRPNYDGEVVNGADLQWTTGLINNALNISDVGATRYIQNKTLLDTPPQDFSVQLWFKPHVTFVAGTALDEYLFSKDNVRAYRKRSFSRGGLPDGAGNFYAGLAGSS